MMTNHAAHTTENTPAPASAKALEGIRVLDLGRVLAAPWATQILGDFGAEIIKIERPGAGDLGRVYGPQFLMDEDGKRTNQSSFFLCANRNKQSVTVNLSHPEGQAIIRALAAQCDVLVENFIAGTMARFGLDYDSLRQINPGLIYCSVTGYGQDGPLAERPGYDAVFQAQGGMMSVTGLPDDVPGGGPMKTGPSLMDVTAGYNAVTGILIALMHRTRTGEGQHLDIALLDGAIACQSIILANYLLDGQQPQRRGNEGNGGGPAQVFQCGDGAIYISAGNDYNYVDLCKVLGRPEMGTDPRYLTLSDRWHNTAALTAELQALIGQWRKAELMAALVAADVACATVNNYDEVFADPQVRHRKIRIAMDHPQSTRGPVPMIASPIRMSGTPASYDQHPPVLGEHTDAVLGGMLGYDAATLQALRERGVV